ncbi:MAG TPA: polysaccharide biosynthesis tyrosine autokinase [Actinomycetota bacterium]|jgi:capsular exopolysaccharide synthesis family protein|nr:polysaccharide biosynthesis tyrosine autokinase [Actinomycetota bacterium]
MTTAPRELHPTPSEGTVDIREFMSKIGRHKWLVLVVAASVTLLVAIYSYSRPSVYQSTAQFLVRPTLVQPLQPNPFDTVSMPNEKQLVTTAQVAEIARGTIGGSLQDVLDGVSVSNPDSTQILEISYSAHTPKDAQAGAQAFADAYHDFKQQQAIATITTYSDTYKKQIDAIDAEIADLDQQMSGLDPASPEHLTDAERRNTLDTTRLNVQNQLYQIATLSSDPGQVVEPAQLPTSPVSPKHKLDLALGFLLGLILGVVLASLRDQARDRIQAPPLVARSLDAPILGSIPRTHRLLVGTAHLASVDEPHGQAAEAYRTLRTNLLAVCRESKAKTILITSARQGEGKTSTAANLAVALAQAGRSVVLISGDLRNPRVHAVFGIGNEQGLGQVLEGTLPLDEAMVETDLPDLRILPSGPVDAVDEPVELLQSDRMAEVLQECCRSDFVVVDGPPIFPVADSLVLADLVDGVLFVTDAQSSTQASVAQSRRQIHQVGGRILGGILNRVPTAWSANGYDADHRWRGLLDRHVLRRNGSALDGIPEDAGAPANN